jgi:hypothetical protein
MKEKAKSIEEIENKSEDIEIDSTIEESRKLSISQKLFKLRYLSKCHLQLCAVQS